MLPVLCSKGILNNFKQNLILRQSQTEFAYESSAFERNYCRTVPLNLRVMLM